MRKLLGPFFDPKSVAIADVSEGATSSGGTVLNGALARRPVLPRALAGELSMGN
jgi:hypothetical protein